MSATTDTRNGNAEGNGERQTPNAKRQTPKASHLPDIHRMLPQAPDAEQGLLSSYLLAPREVHELCADFGLTADFFHIPAHATVFAALEAMTAEKLPIDFITLTGFLQDLNQLAEVGGAAFITHLFTFLPTAANAAFYRAKLEEKFILRQIIKVCTEFAARAYEEQDQVAPLVDELQTAILALDEPGGAQETIVHIGSVMPEVMAAIEQTYRTRGGIIGVPSGLFAIDRMTRGIRKEELCLIAARPSMGKSALLLNMAEHVCYGPGKGTGKTVLIFSLEMPARALVERMMMYRAGINLERARDGYFSRVQWEETKPVAEKMKTGAMYFDDTPGLSIQQLRARARRFVRTHRDTAAIYVDYLQLITSTSPRARENRQLEVSEVSAGLKQLSRELKLPVISAAQLNRENDGLNNLPKLSNLRESGTIEQDADVVIFIHRREYYPGHAEEDVGKATLILAKQRNGPTANDIPVLFEKEHARFDNPEGESFYSKNPAHRQQNLQPEDGGRKTEDGTNEH